MLDILTPSLIHLLSFIAVGTANAVAVKSWMLKDKDALFIKSFINNS